MAYVRDEINANFDSEFGFSFDWKLNSCSTSACDAQYGIVSTDPTDLLEEWAAAVKPISNWGGGAELGIVYKASGIVLCGNGAAWDPGRYASAIASTQCTDYLLSVSSGHELAHLFNGQHRGVKNPDCPKDGDDPEGVHGRARCTVDWVSDMVYVCPPPYDVIYDETGECLEGGYWDDQGSWKVQRSLMWSDKVSGWDFTPTNANHYYIEGCELRGWSGGSYEPGDSTGFIGECYL